MRFFRFLSLALLAATAIFSAAFTPGNLVVYRVGDGAVALSANGAAAFLDEYTPTGTFVQSIALPTSTSGSNRRIVSAGTSATEGQMTRSTDSLYLVFTGYDAATGTASLTTSTSSSVNRVIGRVGNSGVVDTTTALTDASTGSSPRGVASTNGTNLWISGGAGGVRYTTLGATTSTQLSSTVTNMRAVSIFGSQLYTSTQSGAAIRVGTVGSGIPTTSGQTITILPGFSVTSAPNAFFLADLDAGVTGVDTLYVADETAGQILKYSLVSGTWTSNGTITAASVRGLTASVSGSTVTLFVTYNAGSKFASVSDTAGYNAAPSTTTVTDRATAGTNTAFRGVAFAPGITLSIEPASLGTLVSGTPASIPLTVTNGTSCSITLGTGSLPSGLFLNTGTIAGTPDTPGAYSFSLNATCSNGSVSANYSGSVGSPACSTINLSPSSLPNGTQNLAYSQSITATGGTGSYTFLVTNNAPPTGITLSTGGLLAGTTALSGPFTFTVTATDSTVGATCAGSRSYTLTIDVPPPPTLNINQIQGSGNTSPYNGLKVITNGIVTAVKSNGFYLQNAEIDYDANPNTSEAVFVFTSSAPPATATVGNRIQVTATVSEFRPSTDAYTSTVTELVSPTLALTSTGNTLPTPVTITSAMLTPGGGQDQLERLEFMRVKVDSITAVSPTDGTINETNDTASSNGFFYGVITGTATPLRDAGIQTPTPAPTCAAGSGCAIPIFDNNPERIEVDLDRLTGTTAVEIRTGQVITNLVGVLDFAFRAYQIYPDNNNYVVSGTGVAEGTAPAPSASEVTVATYNVERFFDTVNDPSTSDVVATQVAFDGRLNKASLGIRNNLRSPDIIGLEEVENLTVAQAIANKINTDAGTPNLYTAYLTEGNDVGGIDVGFLVKNTVTVSSVTQLGLTTQYASPCDGALAILNDRPPLVLRGTVTKNSRSMDMVVIVNHLRSLSSIDDESTCANGRRIRAKRAAQAEFLANFIQTEQTNNPAAKVISVGDMNSFYVNDGYVDVIGTVMGNPAPSTQVAAASPDLVNPNLLNMLDLIPDPAQRFSYVFDGNHQTLDHIIYTQTLKDQVTNAGYVRLNSEFAETDRNDRNSPRRLSDHDPGVIYITTAQPITAGLQVLRSGLVANRTTGIYSGSIILRNTGAGALTGPFTLVLSGLPAGISLFNATGTNLQGAYIVNAAATIAPGGSLTIPIQLLNPGNLAISYSTKVYSGAF